MMVQEILYHPNFERDLRTLDHQTHLRIQKAERLFRADPLHPSLRLHRLGGRLSPSWSISVTRKIRIVFSRLPKGTVVFYSVGSHDIYR